LKNGRGQDRMSTGKNNNDCFYFRKRVTMKKGIKKTVSLLLCFILLFSTVGQGVKAQGAVWTSFPDLSSNAWYTPYVQDLVSRDIIAGMPDGKFYPDKTLTKAQFLKMLAVAYGKTLHEEGSWKPTFTDVPSNAWYATYVAWGVKNKLVNGVGNKKFNPNGLITREQMALMLYRFSRNVMGRDLPQNKTVACIDMNQVSSWASVEVRRILASGIMEGHSNGAFRPNQKATRAQAAKILSVYLEQSQGYSKWLGLKDLKYIQHGGGEVMGYTLTNSKQALDHSRIMGNNVIELDFSWTSDGQLVCVHHWGNPYPPLMTLDKFMQQSIFGYFTPLSLDTLAAWMRANPMVRIVPDFKRDNVLGLQMIASRYPDLKSRFLPYVLHAWEYDSIHALGYPYLFLMTYQMGTQERLQAEANVQFARSHGMLGVVTNPYVAFSEYCNASRKYGVPLIFYTLDNSSDMEIYRHSGVDGYITNKQSIKIPW
jgi:glycerophosphoryl diester phosphodiesterase